MKNNKFFLKNRLYIIYKKQEKKTRNHKSFMIYEEGEKKSSYAPQLAEKYCHLRFQNKIKSYAPQRVGIAGAARQVKRAIQFGTRIAKQSNARVPFCMPMKIFFIIWKYFSSYENIFHHIIHHIIHIYILFINSNLARASRSSLMLGVLVCFSYLCIIWWCCYTYVPYQIVIHICL